MPQSSDRKARQDELIAVSVCIGMAVLMLTAMVVFTFFA
jgi:hypothetical protein